MNPCAYRPSFRPVRWLADVGRDLDDAVRNQFRASFFSSVGPLVGGGLNSACIATLAWFRTGMALLLVLALFDLATIALRLFAMRNVGRRPWIADLLFLGSLAWCCSQAIATTLAFASKDMLLIILFGSSTVATAAGIASRNFGAPRFALAQILILDVTFKVNVVLLDWKGLGIVALLQGTLFLFINLGLIAGLRRLTIKALEGEAANRALAARDPLTGLANRRGLEEAYARRTGTLSAFAIDLDGFKLVNDRHGHAAGDVVLVGVAARLRECCVGALSICRLGGDEFVVLMEQVGGYDRAALAARLVAVLTGAYRLDGVQRASVGASVGVASGDATLDALLSAADRALYAAKTAGKGQYVLAETLPAVPEPPLDAAAPAQDAA